MSERHKLRWQPRIVEADQVKTEQSVDLSIIIVSYNTREMTRACLNSIRDQTHELNWECIVVDNASTDGSAEMLASHSVVTTCIQRSDNLGFAAANNLAARQARGKKLLLLNPDTLVLDRAIDRLWAFSKRRPKARIWGGRTLFADGSLNRTNCWRRITLWNAFCRTSGLTGVFPNSALFNPEPYGGDKREDERSVDIVSGCFFMIERDLWETLDGFDPAFFMYGEEADLCLRATQHNAQPRISPAATIIHYGGASETARTDKMVKLLTAKIMLVDRHVKAPIRTLVRALMASWPLTRWLAHTALHRIKPNNGHDAKAAVWRDIWDARHKWLNGFEHDAPSQTAPAFQSLTSA